MKQGLLKIFSLAMSVSVFLTSTALISSLYVLKANAEEDSSVVVVLDPGHGGANLGTNYLPTDEKAYTLKIAEYTKEYLEEYKGIKVYMTRTDDTDMSLLERAQFAQDVDADFLYSLHFNASIEHDLYGAEVWIPSEGEMYSQAYSQGKILMDEFSDIGLVDRGIKTKVSKQNDEDYYGIIRYCSSMDIPSIIIEHCHLDHSIDAKFIADEDSLKALAKSDADSIAKYFGLTKKDGSVDYSNYAPLAVAVPEDKVYQDDTAPVYVRAKLINYDKLSQYGTFTLEALDEESSLQYYSYSLDNGTTWSTYAPWKSTSNIMTVTIPIRYKNTNSIIFKVSNCYDGNTVSEVVALG